MRKLMRVAAGLVVVAGTALAVTGAPAEAQDNLSSHYGGLRDHCVGTRIDAHDIKTKKGKLVGRTELWYSQSNGGQNCVMTYNRAGSPFTRTYLWRSSARAASLTPPPATRASTSTTPEAPS
jgi:hypothetical protein